MSGLLLGLFMGLTPYFSVVFSLLGLGWGARLFYFICLVLLFSIPIRPSLQTRPLESSLAFHC